MRRYDAYCRQCNWLVLTVQVSIFWRQSSINSLNQGSSSSVGTSSKSLPTIASATFHTWSRLSSAAEQRTHGSFRFQLKSEMRLVCPPCWKRLHRKLVSNRRTTERMLVIHTALVGRLGHLQVSVPRLPYWDPRKRSYGHSLRWPEQLLRKDAMRLR